MTDDGDEEDDEKESRAVHNSIKHTYTKGRDKDG
jgi:hypothetical protein